MVVTKQCKCSYKNGCLIVRDEDVRMIHLSEIYCLYLESTAVSVTTYLINELVKRKIHIIVCDEQHNPCAEILALYGSHNTSKRVAEQFAWTEENKSKIWTLIVREKICRQAALLASIGNESACLLANYADEVVFNDATNREGHAAKVYFNALFGLSFTREEDTYLNAALDYGYSLLLSAFNREVVANGYITQIGVCHRNEFNQFNLSCDLMEPFRPIVDRFVYGKMPFVFDAEIRFGLVDLLNTMVNYDGGEYYLTSVIAMYTKNVLSCIASGERDAVKFYQPL